RRSTRAPRACRRVSGWRARPSRRRGRRTRPTPRRRSRAPGLCTSASGRTAPRPSGRRRVCTSTRSGAWSMAEFRHPTRIGYRVGRSGGDANMNNVPFAAGSAVDDVVVLVCFIMSATVRVNAPSGWVQVGDAVVDGARTLQLLARRLDEADLAVGSKSFTLTSNAGITWSSMTVRGSVDPDELELGTPWTRSGTSSTISAPSVDVDQAGSLVLGILSEASAAAEVEADVSATGATRWFFQPHQTTIPHTHLVTFVDSAAVGPTSTVNAVYPSGSASTDAVGVQLVLPGSE